MNVISYGFFIITTFRCIVVYWIVLAIDGNDNNDPTLVNIFGGAEWTVHMFYILPFVTLLNFIPIKFKNDQSDGYHLFIKNRKDKSISL